MIMENFSNMDKKLIENWREEEKSSHIQGWDFSHIHGRYEEENDLPLAPKEFIHYYEENDRPQPLLDRDNEKGMQITVGRLREDNLFDYKFVGLSHNTLRGAAGGAVLTAELIKKLGYLD